MKKKKIQTQKMNIVSTVIEAFKLLKQKKKLIKKVLQYLNFYVLLTKKNKKLKILAIMK